MKIKLFLLTPIIAFPTAIFASCSSSSSPQKSEENQGGETQNQMPDNQQDSGNNTQEERKSENNGSGVDQQDSGKHNSTNQMIQMSVKTITVNDLDWDSFANNSNDSKFSHFLNEVNDVLKNPSKYSSVRLNVETSISSKYSKEYSVEDFSKKINTILNKSENLNLKNSVNNSNSIVIGQDEEYSNPKQVEKFLTKEFKNYIISKDIYLKQWYTPLDTLDKQINRRAIGKIKRNVAIEKSKENEYNNIVEKIKTWFKENASIEFAENVIFEEININSAFSYNLDIQLKINEATTKFITLDFEKAKENMSDEDIKNANLNRGFGNKIKNVWANIEKSEFYKKLNEKVLKTIQILIVLNGDAILVDKVVDLILNSIQNSLKKNNNLAIPDVVLKQLGKRVIKPYIQSHIRKLLEQYK